MKTKSSMIPEPVTPPVPAPQPVRPAKTKPSGMVLKENGVLLLFGEIDDDNVTPIVTSILEANLEPKKTRLKKLVLYIDSPGGNLAVGLKLVDIIRSSRIPVHTIATGVAASMALMILMAGHRRYATENTLLLSHQFKGTISGKQDDLFSGIRGVEIYEERVLNHYAKCTKKTKPWIKKNLLLLGEVYLTPEEAIAAGIIDEVLLIY